MQKLSPILMKISIVVVTYNEERNIEECLKSLIDQEYPRDEYEIIVVDGCSVDKTQEIVEKMITNVSVPKIRLIKNPVRTISSNRNVGIKEAMYEYVAFTDADCICHSNWLSQLVNGFRLNINNLSIAAVGGGNRSHDSFGKVSQAIGIAFLSYLAGLGTVQTKGPNKMMPVESLACLNVMYRRDVVISLGGFDERLGNIGEDWDLNFRLRKAGYNLIFLPDSEVIHKMRVNWKQFMYQMLHYGLGRAELMRKNHRTVNLKYILPLSFILGIFGTMLLGFIYNSLFLLVPLFYSILISLEAYYMCVVHKKLNLWWSVSVALVLIHFGYGLGEWYGICRTINKMFSPRQSIK